MPLRLAIQSMPSTYWFNNPPVPEAFATTGAIGCTDVDFGNIVFRDQEAVALIDFDFGGSEPPSLGGSRRRLLPRSPRQGRYRLAGPPTRLFGTAEEPSRRPAGSTTGTRRSFGTPSGLFTTGGMNAQWVRSGRLTVDWPRPLPRTTAQRLANIQRLKPNNLTGRHSYVPVLRSSGLSGCERHGKNRPEVYLRTGTD